MTPRPNSTVENRSATCFSIEQDRREPVHPTLQSLGIKTPDRKSVSSEFRDCMRPGTRPGMVGETVIEVIGVRHQSGPLYGLCRGFRRGGRPKT